MQGSSIECVVIGAGPAGLTAAYELAKLGRSALVLEQDRVVGGISRTCVHDGYRFDIGGHRFFTKVDYVRELWHEILADELITRPRLSRIYYQGRFFDYPLKPVNALLGLGPIEAVRIGLSYLRAQLLPAREERNFEEWVTRRFGRRLYEIFFKTYTEKVWGMPCSEISADWASQRIKNLDLLAAVKNALVGSRALADGEVITTLIEQFEYPRLGPGQMWERCVDLLAGMGTKTLLGAEVVRVRHDGGRIHAVGVREDGGHEYEVHADHFLSTMPIRTLLHALDPAPPEEVLAAANRLRYRDFLTVALILEGDDLFPDNWIYIHSDDVRVGRIQNFKNWSPDMVPEPGRTSLGLEYFVREGDELWSMDDADLIALARDECSRLGLAPAEAVVDGAVVRMPKAYPVYDGEYREALEEIRGWLGGLSNLQLIGRNGQHRYNNQDHSMVTGVYAARNIAGASYDVWDVNVEEEYHEEVQRSGASGERLVPQRAQGPTPDELLRQLFGRYDPVGLGVAVGTVLGLGLLLATSILLLRGAEPMGPNLSLLANYFLGYSVSWTGALVGFVEASVGGFAFGWVLARMINALVGYEEKQILASIQAARAMDLFEGDAT